MINHFSTLQKLAEEFNTELRDGTIVDIFTQFKNELYFTVNTPTLVKTLAVSINPQLNYVFLRERVARAKRNSVSLFPALSDKQIKRITAHLYDRVINIELSDNLHLKINLFGTASSNIFLVDDENIVRDSFKNSKEYIHKNYRNISKSRNFETGEGIFLNYKKFEERFLAEGSKPTFSVLKTVYPFIGSTLARETLHRCGIEDKVHISELTKDDCKIIYQKLTDLFIELSKPQPTIYYTNDIPRVLSMIPLQHMAGSRQESFTTANEAVRSFVVKSFIKHDIDAEKKDLLIKIRNELDKAKRTESATTREISESKRADDYEHIAKVIMTNLQHLTKGTKDIDVEDVFHENRLMRITLEPKLTPPQNAEKYFDKARRARESHKVSMKRYEEIKINIMLLEKLLLHLDNCQTRDQIMEFKEEYENDLRRLHLISPKANEAALPFRVFSVAGGFEVLVGKSAANNDLLTMKYAKPNDLWFHARGAGGSHVVLRVGNSNTKPGKEAIHQTASIAAYYSKMRNAGNVPVAYCERKYVRKPKGVNSGTVTLEREKVVFVEPELPQEKK